LLGWASRQPILGSAAGIVTVNGLFRPFALVRGRAAATWAMPRGKVEISPFGRLSAADAAALDDEALDVTRFLGRPDTAPPVERQPRAHPRRRSGASSLEQSANDTCGRISSSVYSATDIRLRSSGHGKRRAGHG